LEVVTGGQPFCFGVNVAVSITGETPTNLLKSAIWTKISGFFPIKLGENAFYAICLEIIGDSPLIDPLKTEHRNNRRKFSG